MGCDHFDPANGSPFRRLPASWLEAAFNEKVLTALKEMGFGVCQFSNDHNIDLARLIFSERGFRMAEFEAELEHPGPVRAIVAQSSLRHLPGQDDLIVGNHISGCPLLGLCFGRFFR